MYNKINLVIFTHGIFVKFNEYISMLNIQRYKLTQ